jgi:ATP-dependent Clp endopeptidase proteolytic subunit ClpP
MNLIPDTTVENLPAIMLAPGKSTEKSDNIVDNGILFMTDDFNQKNCMPLITAIMEYNLRSPETRPDVIRLYINSRGGHVDSCMHLVDIVKQSRIPVYTYGMGMIASCGVMLMMAGAKGHRYLTQNTAVMSHEFSGGFGGQYHDMVDSHAHMKWTNDKLLEHYIKCTGKKKKYIRKYLLAPRTDHYLTPAEAVTHGIADHVITTY